MATSINNDPVNIARVDSIEALVSLSAADNVRDIRDWLNAVSLDAYIASKSIDAPPAVTLTPGLPRPWLEIGQLSPFRPARNSRRVADARGDHEIGNLDIGMPVVRDIERLGAAAISTEARHKPHKHYGQGPSRESAVRYRTGHFATARCRLHCPKSERTRR
jgi:hypothetical protein